MQFLALLASVALVPSVLAAGAPTPFNVQVTYDTTYDNAGQSMNTVACSNGDFGLVKKYPTFGDIPVFPFVGGSQVIPGWNSPSCGSCFSLTTLDGKNSIKVVAIDHADNGFNIALAAMNKLTNGRAVELGVVQAVALGLPPSACGM